MNTQTQTQTQTRTRTRTRTLATAVAVVLGLAAVAESCSPAEASSPAGGKEILLLATDRQGNPLFASPAGTANRPLELSWTLCVQQEDSCRQEEFTRQWRVSLPAGHHKATLRILCPAGGDGPQRWLRFTRTITLAGNSPARGAVIAVAGGCEQ